MGMESRLRCIAGCGLRPPARGQRSAQQGADPGAKLPGARRLDQRAIGAQVQALDPGQRVALDEGDDGYRRQGPETLQCFASHEIKDDQVGLDEAELVLPVDPIGCGADLELAVDQETGHRLLCLSIVCNDQYLFGHKPAIALPPGPPLKRIRPRGLQTAGTHPRCRWQRKPRQKCGSIIPPFGWNLVGMRLEFG